MDHREPLAGKVTDHEQRHSVGLALEAVVEGNLACQKQIALLGDGCGQQTAAAPAGDGHAADGTAGIDATWSAVRDRLTQLLGDFRERP